MGCSKQYKIWEESDKVQAKWIDSEILEKWGYTNDALAFQRLFEASTGKPFLSGEQLQPKDFRKMFVAIETLEKDLHSPGILSNKVLRNFYVGSAKAMRNPVTKHFYETLVNANEFRNRHSSEMMASYSSLISELKLAIMDNQGEDTYKMSTGNIQKRDLIKIGNLKSKMKARKVFRDLNKKEIALVKKMQEGEKPGSTAKEMDALFSYLEGEGAVFQDFMDRVTSGNNLGLKYKYRDRKQESSNYIRKIDNAAQSWSKIQAESSKMFVQSIDNLSSTIKLKYGTKSRTADFLIEEYSKIQTRLQESEDGYIPHYVIDILGQSLEITQRMAKSKTDSERDDILGEYITKAREINTNLSQRLKAKSKDPSEYFSRNPMLYVSKYIEQVTQFNHNSFVDLAYTEGLQKLTSIGMKNDGAEKDAAKVYGDILNDMYSQATNKNRRVDQSENADNLVRLVTSMQFVSKLGLSTRGALRNGTQRLLNFAYFGGLTWTDSMKAYKTDSYKKAMETELHHHGLEFVDISKVTEGAVTAADLTGHGINFKDGMFTMKDKENILSKMTKAGVKMADASSILTKWAENGNRKSTFKVAFHKRVEQLKKTDKFAFVKEGSPEQKQMHVSAGNYAAKMVELLHFEYSGFGKAGVLQSKPGAILGQFMHYAFSFANLQTQMIKDYGRAIKAGDYTGEEAGRLVRLGIMYGMTELISGLSDINFTSYVQNDTLDRSMELIKFLTGDEEEKREAFYGKGVAGALGSVPVSDLIELHNLGAAAGYWKLLADENSTAGWLMGMKNYDRIDTKEFLQEGAGMFSIEAERLIRRTVPALFYKGNPVTNALAAELGLYPGVTTLGIKTRDFRKKSIKTLQEHGWLGKPGKSVKKPRDYQYSPYKKQRKNTDEAALFNALDLLDKQA